MGVLRTGNPHEIDTAVRELAAMEQRALPALIRGFEVPRNRDACAEVLALMPARVAVPVLEARIDKATTLTASDRRHKGFLVGALGRLKAPETVSYLESLFEHESDSELRLAIAWALKEVTGRDYGPAYDPWMQGR